MMLGIRIRSDVATKRLAEEGWSSRKMTTTTTTTIKMLIRKDTETKILRELKTMMSASVSNKNEEGLMPMANERTKRMSITGKSPETAR